MLRGIANLVRTAVCLIVLPIGLFATSASVWLSAMLGASRERINEQYFFFARLCTTLGGTELHVSGHENLVPGQAYVIVPNHESNWDPICIVRAVEPQAVRFLVKRQIVSIPIFGHALLQSGNILVERSNTTRDVERIRQQMAERPLEVSMLFYAEGTRSRDGALHEFKKGAFATAISYGLPVLPIGHAGCFRIWRPNSALLRKGGVEVEIGEPIPIDGLGLEDRTELRDRTREAVAKLRDRARMRLRERGWEPGGID